MKYPIVIGVSGRKRSGKDEVFRALQTHFGQRDVARIAFADGVKEEVVAACGTSISFIEANKEMFRPILQWWGTDFRRNQFGKDYWINVARDKFDSIKGQAKVVVFTDCRFPNEAELVRSLGGVVWRVQRAGDSGDTHVSETALDNDPFDHIFLNNKSLEEFHTSILRAFHEDFILKEPALENTSESGPGLREAA